jgi:5-methylthioadenosine/S-adenosylhomocysteine deaminase
VQGVDLVVGICSVGSLKASIGVGSLVVCDDFYCPTDLRRIFKDARAHLMPGFDEKLRKALIDGVREAGFHPLTHGTYVNTHGPRFETKAEIRMLAQAGDVVGMTGAHECVACCELKIPYAMLAMVDNFAHGIGTELTVEAFHVAQAENLHVVEQCVAGVISHLQMRMDLAVGVRSPTDAGEEIPSTPAGAGAVPSVPAVSSTPLPTPAVSSPVAPINVDTVIHARFVVPVAPGREDQVLDHHSVAVLNGVIIDILPTAACMARYTATRVIHLDDHHALMPGMINAHTHLPLNLLRGVADDMPLAQWLTEQIWPTEARLVSPEFCKAGAIGAIAELIRTGVTCINEMYWFPDAAADVIDASGMRGTVGMTVIEFPSSYAAKASEYVDRGMEMKMKWDAKQIGKAPARIRFSVAPHAPYTVCDATFETLRDLATTHDMKIHVHLHETTGEVEQSKSGTAGSTKHLSEHRISPVENLDRMGMLSERLIAVHMTQLSDAEISRLAATKSNVVHCPNSNLKLASGFCPVGKLLAAGVNVAIGTDSASSNNSLDFFQEMKLAALLAKGVSSDATVVPAWQALRMATINGAIALGIADHTGSLEAGKRADMIAINLNGLDQLPVYNVISHLVYATNRTCVTDVWVDGQQLLDNRKLVTLDEQHVRDVLAKWATAVRPGMTAHDKHDRLPAEAAAHVHTTQHGEAEAGKLHVKSAHEASSQSSLL